jgi:hypothetical protein
LPCPASTATVTTGPGNLGDQLAYGERQGADSGRPEVQGRLVFQWQLDHAKGVAPAQVIFSAMQGARTAIVVASQIPTCTNTAGFFPLAVTTLRCNSDTGVYDANFFKKQFPTGATVNTSRNGWTGGFQLPTRYATFVANYYRGTDLRFYFSGQLLKEFNNFTNPAFTGTASPNQAGCPAGFNCGFSIDGASTIAFAALDPGASATPTTVATAVAVPQGVVRSQGGFAEINIPLSRIAHADPTGRNAGWTMTMHYGLDSVFARDARRIGTTQPRQSSWGFGNIQYKLNQYVTFGYELGIYSTINLSTATWQGIPQHQVHDLHSEFATIFSF